MRSTMACDVGRYSRCGRELRSARPPSPSLLWRSTHLRTVRGQTPTASLTAFGGCPLAAKLTIHSRPRGVSRAFLCTFIRFLSSELEVSQPQFPRPEPDGQPIESSQLEHGQHARHQRVANDVCVREAHDSDVGNLFKPRCDLAKAG